MNRARWVGPTRLVVTGLAAAGLVTAAALSPATELAGSQAQPARATTLEPVATASLSCPGPELSGIKGVEDIDVPAAVAAATAPQSVLGSSVRTKGKGQVSIRSGKVAGSTATTRGVTTSTDSRSSSSSDIVATGALAPGLAATQEWSVNRDEINGLATVSCAGPGSDLWLLAGAGAPGRQERVVLTNPGANEVTVDMQVLGRKGIVPSPTGSTVVPARGRVALLVDAISGAEESPALHVRANGGTVRAVMSDIWLDGSVPVGAETTVPTAAPATTQVIPTYVSGTTGALRVAVPGNQQAVVSAQLLGRDGATPLPGGVIRVPARSSGDLPVKGVAPGWYSVRVSADVPIVASMFSAWRLGSNPGDFTWSPSTEATTTGLLGAAFPENDDAVRTLSVSSVGSSSKVSVTWRDGGKWNTRTVDLAQDASSTLSLGQASAVWVRRASGAGEIRAGVGTMGGNTAARLVSVTPLVESAVTSQVSSAHPVS